MVATKTQPKCSPTQDLHQTPTQPETRLLIWAIRALLLALALAILIFPLIPEKKFIPVRDNHVVLILRGHFTKAKFHEAWGLLGSTKVPASLRWFLVIGVIGSCFVPIRTGPRPARNEETSRRRWIFVVGTGLAAAVFFHIFSIPFMVNRTFGDAYALAKTLESSSDVYPAEILMTHCFHGVRWFLKNFMIPNGAMIGRVTACLLGGFFISGIAFFSISIGRTRVERMVLFFGGVLAGYTAQFFGYVETTSGVMAAMTWFFACAAQTIDSKDGAQKYKWFAASSIALGLAMMFHGGGIILLPCVPLLLIVMNRSWRGLIDWRALAILFILTAVPYYFVVLQPYYLQGHFGNITTGADAHILLPLQFDPGQPHSPWLYYSLFSKMHALDLASGIFISTPLALFMIVGAGWVFLRLRNKPKFIELQPPMIIAAAACGGAFLVFVWHFDFAIWGDWNIATAYLFPLNLLAWTAFVYALRLANANKGATIGLFTPMILVQLFCAFGILMQLYYIY